ncbi:hypothetical protein BTO30_13500 [Domibacillus antri]|uniref:Uncharacterized protein n=1 Tax=Domibacillus antri TaxID=1714264 RepID=A0A1Q8Q302_9BACI|nr:hypothetical protein [Domibacillus antri]OLN21713.1 hypothetical protein BTO30_13500 [Domibacillus antri]
MVKVKMLKSVGSANGVHQPGHIVDLEEKVAAAWIKAELAEEADQAESKAKPAHENKMVKPDEDKEADEKPTRRRTPKKKIDEDAE